MSEQSDLTTQSVRELEHHLHAEIYRLKEDVELAWSLIAGVREWEDQPLDWQQAAARWRDERYLRITHKAG